jgi:AcrR family transcriptional regulator
MARTRQALLDGAAVAVARYGTRITMTQVAACAGVAKATLYNHLRTRDDVLAAVVVHEVRRLIDAVAGLPAEVALLRAATAVAAHPAVRRLADHEPAVLAALARVDESAPAWAETAAAVRRLVGGDPVATAVLLRWLSSVLTTPADAEALRGQLGWLLGGAERAAARPAG